MIEVLEPEQISYLPLFHGSNIQGDVESPVEGANCNVVFPNQWGHWRCAMWRQQNDCPGAGWDYERGFHTIGVPTIGGRFVAWALNRIYGVHRCK